MPKISIIALFHLLIFALIAQTLSGVLPPAAVWRRLSRREIGGATENLKAAAANDRDTAAMIAATTSDQIASLSDDQISSKLKSIEGISANASTTDADSESEIAHAVKSTKLLPALGNNLTSPGEHKSSEKLMLNRVESHEAEGEDGNGVKKVMEESEENEEVEKKDDISTAHHDSSEFTDKQLKKYSEEQDEANTTRLGLDGVFSKEVKALEKSLTPETLNKHINNGLDETALGQLDGKSKSAHVKDEQPATTEVILTDVENVALKVLLPTTPPTLVKDGHAEDAKSDLEERKSEIMHSTESLDEANQSMGHSMDAVQSSENKLEATFGEKPSAEEVLLKETATTTMPKTILVTRTNTETVASESKAREEAHKDIEGTTKMQLPTTDATKTIANEHQLNENKTDVFEQQRANEQIEATELPQKSQSKTTAIVDAETTKAQQIPSMSSTSSVEKRAKFILDNSTNSQNMHLPDGPEVWSLAGMRTVPKVLHNNRASTLVANDSSDANLRWQTNEILTTERTPNVSSYSEKNLLDWTKVVGMRGELEPEGTIEKNQITEGAVERERIDAVKATKTEELPLRMVDKLENEEPSKVTDVENNEQLTHLTTEGTKMLNVTEKSQVMNEFDKIQIGTPTEMPTFVTTGLITTPTTAPTATQAPLSSDSALSVDKSDKHADSISTVSTAGIGESLNKSSFASTTESSNLQQSAEKTGVENFNSAESSNTQRQPSDDFNFIVTSTTPLAAFEVASATTAMPITNETTSTTTTAAPMLTALPVEHSTSTLPSLNGTEATQRWDNITAREAQTETTKAILPNNVDAAVNSTKVDISSSTGGVHDVTLELHSKREPETVTETETEQQTTLLTVSELPTSEAHRLTSAGERISNVNANVSASVERGADISTQNETPNVATETTTESSQIATTTATIILTNTTVLSTDLVATNVSAKTSEVPGVTATTTEVGQIVNEVELEVHTVNITDATEGTTDAATATLNSDTGSSTNKVLEEAVTEGDEASITAKSVSSINELLMPVNDTTTTTTTSTTAVPITAPPTQEAVEPVLYTATTLKGDVSTNEETTTKIIPLAITTVQPTGSVLDKSTTTTTQTPVDFRNHTAAAEGSHDTESSIETNVIDQPDKTTMKISESTATKPTTSTTTAITPTTINELGVENQNPGGKSETVSTQNVPVFGVSNETTLPSVQDADMTTSTTTATTTPMATLLLSPNSTSVSLTPAVNNSSSGMTTTQAPLINLLDDSTTPATTTPSSTPNQSPATTSSIGVKPQEVYTVFSTTEDTPTTSTSTAVVAPHVPILNTTSTVNAPVDSSTTAYIPIVVNTIATVTTTMLPPTLHAGIGGGASSVSSPTHLNRGDSNETDVNVIIAITVSIIGVVALILLVAFLYLMRKRQKQMSYGQRCRPVSLDAYSLDNVSVLGSVRRKGALRASKRSYGNIAFDDPSLRHNTLSASELAKFVERRSSIFEEFRDVPQIIARADEVPPGCEDKNRYANVIPLPETRVVLQQLGDDDKTEYINANYVRGPKDSPNYYIATQAPLETTVTDFWRMIWEQQSRVIIQATDLYENGIEKCAEYLPPSVTLDNHTTFGDFQITLKHREVKDKYAISTLMLKNTAENMSRELTHYWYKWPETGVPNEEAPIIAMLLEARSSLKGYVNEAREKNSNATLKSDADGEVTANGNGVTVISMENGGQKIEMGRVNGTAKDDGGNAEINGNISAADKMKGTTTLRNQGPLTIHCSPGTGRTGTIIACDMAIRSLETPKRSVDIPQTVYYVRRGRASAVQTKEQYEFIYKVAHMYATKITNLSNDN
ncbi:mucin-2 isoform X1 [Anastrepha ludens]|uniref:mucin-2 isoform X1 n=1 Tax=Anastrepha ludens TaxID=28586 RepID=UPI0023B0812B|nr:mucin-2 isoform X1 [Anastrepha ludens]XP_053960299.1 mucin-2 isoform X1 [Anastrepha ludens]